MKKAFLLLCFAAFLNSINILAQKPVLDLTFTGVNEEEWVPLESIIIKNITRGVDTFLVYPDTVLTIYYQVGINESDQQTNEFKVFQNFPNPVKNISTIKLFIPDKGNVNISIMDATGRVIINTDQKLDRGYHSYEFMPGNDHLYFFTARWGKISNSIKIINTSTNSASICSLNYINHTDQTNLTKSTKNIQSFSFDKGDDLIYIGTYNEIESGIFDEPKTDASYTFQFATNIPCPGTSTITYEGQIYNTIQIFSQCWLVENLNVGTMINGDQEMEDNNAIEKYCYNNDEEQCNEHGGLYQWNELMQYSTSEGSQGICPSGWHVPADGDLIILSGAADTEYSFGDPEWYNDGFNGSDAGLNLKSETEWFEDGNGLDTFGFTARPGGQRISNGYFDGLTKKASFWSSEEDWPGAAWYLSLSYLEDGVDRSSQTANWGKSVRCIKD